MPRENAVFQNRLNSQPLNEKRIFQEYKQLLWCAFDKAKASTCFSWEVPAPLVFCHRAGLSSAQNYFQACESREDSLELVNKTTPDITSPGTGGALANTLREGTYPRDNCMKRLWEELLHVQYEIIFRGLKDYCWIS